MQELSIHEIEAVSGGGTLIGDVITGSVTLANAIFNTPLVSSVGQIFNRIGLGLQYVHFAADAAGYIGFKAAESIGVALGGDPVCNYHLEREWGIAPL